LVQEIGQRRWTAQHRAGLREARWGLAVRPTESRRWGMTNGPGPGGTRDAAAGRDTWKRREVQGPGPLFAAGGQWVSGRVGGCVEGLSEWGPGSNAGRNERRLLRTTRQLQKTKKEEEKKNLTATNVHAHQANVPSDLQPRANFEMTVAAHSKHSKHSTTWINTAWMTMIVGTTFDVNMNTVGGRSVPRWRFDLMRQNTTFEGLGRTERLEVDDNRHHCATPARQTDQSTTPSNGCDRADRCGALVQLARPEAVLELVMDGTIRLHRGPPACVPRQTCSTKACTPSSRYVLSGSGTDSPWKQPGGSESMLNCVVDSQGQ
ncbi:uncharacterized protein TRIREDRAFT_111372, partial [Trichoderma reesei QM6a]